MVTNLPRQLTSCRGFRFRPIPEIAGRGEGSMASSSSIRALILGTVSVLTASPLPCSTTAETPRGWYDQQLNCARGALEQHLYSVSARDTIIAFASLDRIY